MASHHSHGDGTPSRTPVDASRYAAVVAALIDVRPDEATARFDAEVASALAQNRIDPETARSLRWWQRASVRAAESYAKAVVPGMLAIRDQANLHATTEAAQMADAWRRANEMRASLDATSEPANAYASAEGPAIRLVPAHPPGMTHGTDQTRKAVRAVLAAEAGGTVPGPDRATPRTTQKQARQRGEDGGRDANPATSA